MTKCWRAKGLRVGIIAVDPTSPFTGGAILGDRVRMGDLTLDTGVFIRSMGTRGQLGGLSPATAGAVHALDACGYDLILLENRRCRAVRGGVHGRFWMNIIGGFRNEIRS